MLPGHLTTSAQRRDITCIRTLRIIERHSYILVYANQATTRSLACLLSQVLDADAGEAITAPSTIAGIRRALIGSVTLGARDLRLPDALPPCKVVELPVELPVVRSAKTAGGATLHNHHIRGPTMTMFLEKASAPYHDTVSVPHAVLSTTIPAVAMTTTQDEETNVPNIENLSITPKTRATTAGNQQERPLPAERKMMQLKTFRVWGLAAQAKVLDAIVRVRACGRDVGTTRVSAVGGTTAPEWIDEQ